MILQLSNSVYKLSNVSILAIGASCSLINGNTILELPLESVKITRRVGTYTVINCACSDELISSILSIINGARISLKINGILSNGNVTVMSSFSLNISDYNYDDGPTSKSVSFTSRTPINIPANVGVKTINAVQGERKLNSTPITYQFYCDPLEYLNFGLGTNITDGTFSGVVVANILELYSDRISRLTVEAQ